MSSIQDFVKKVNSTISDFTEENLAFEGLLALCILSFSVLFTCVLSLIDTRADFHHFIYKDGDESVLNQSETVDPIIASRSGKTFYYSWCSGVNRIKQENRIIFPTKESAESSGRTLSKTCLK